jgi:DNA-binding SARP family transcriptional activator/tetratricopeptide (TPR) repeat protein
MEYRVLGSLEVSAQGRARVLPGPRAERILAALLCRPNRIVELDRLIEAVWADDPPDTARRQVQNQVAALRAVLTPLGGFIDTGDSGYRIRVAPGELDAAAFDDLVDRGRAAADAGLLRRALALWRGPAFAGLADGPMVATEAQRLTEKRLAALEECIDLELAAGRNAEIADELAGLVAEHPRRERFVGQLMTARYRSGRPADALATYDELAARLGDELGIDPSPELRRLREAIGRGEPEPSDRAAAPAITPAQLPADAVGFTGRTVDLARLDGLLSDGQTRSTVIISAIAGTAGVGKTALAVHWAHRVRDKFPDGQLHVNLRGYAQTPPVRPIEALSSFLRALGVAAGNVPAEVDAAAALYRGLLAGKRVLVLLDNAASAEQVRPLLPATPGSLALVTSRDTLADLAARDDATRIRLDVLTPDEAYALLTRLLGEQRASAEPGAVVELARLCAYLPLALRITAANLADTERVADYAARLAAGNRLAALQVDGDEQAAVRAAFDLSYAALPAPAQQLFRLLGLHAGPDVTAAAAASLVGRPVDEVRPPLDDLVRAHLLTELPGGRYGSHDLLRAYATELAGTLDEPDRAAAARRILDHYLHSAHAAVRLLDPARDLVTPEPPGPGVIPEQPADHAAAMAWFAAEYPALRAAAERAADAGFDDHVWHLAWSLLTFQDIQGYWHDLIATQDAARAAAQRQGDHSGQAFARRALARACSRLGRYDDALGHYEHTLDLYRELGDDVGRANTHLGFAGIHEMQGRYADALRHAELALAAHRAAGHPVGQARALNQVGWCHALVGNYEQAIGYCEPALALLRELGDRRAEAHTWDSLGYAHHRLGDFPRAVSCYRSALDLFAEVHDRYNEAATLARLGDAHRDAGDLSAAREAWRRSLLILDQLDHADAAEVRAKLLS